MANDTEEIQARDIEHEAWGKIAEELRRLGIELNDENYLSALIALWGEYLVSFRFHQSPATRVAALAKRTDTYLQVIGDVVAGEIEQGNLGLRVLGDCS